MKSIRTPIAKKESPMFRAFLDSVGLNDVIIGDYEKIDKDWYSSIKLCYAYSEKSNEVVATLTHILLKYGNIETAFYTYMNALMTSAVNDPYFNWTP